MWDVSRDLRIAVRLLIRTPGPTSGMLTSLAIGVGACTAVFSWINATLLEPFPAVAGSGEYVVLASRSPSGALEPLSHAAYGDLRDAAPVFDHLVAVGATLTALNLDTGPEGRHTERVFANFVSGNYFNELGLTPEIARVFGADEDRVPGRDAVVVISHSLWQRRFAGVPDIVGRPVHLNGRSCTIIGVADRRFIGTLVGLSVDLWAPIIMQPALVPAAAPLENRSVRWTLGLGRVKAGLSHAEAEARVRAASRHLAAQYPDTDDRQATLIPIWRSPWGAQGGTGPVLLMFAGVVCFLLLLSCANAANLLLVRAISRQRETATQLAIGASRGRIVRQLLTESVLLALVAGGVGLIVAYLSSDLMLFFLPPTDSPFVFGRGVDSAVVVFALGLGFLTVLLFGLAPALGASRRDVVTALKEAEGSVGATRSRLRRGLAVIQVAMCVIMLAGAGLFLRSLQEARRVSPGFSPDDVILATYEVSQLGYSSERGAIFHQQLLARAASIPGVETATLAARVPPRLHATPVAESHHRWVRSSGGRRLGRGEQRHRPELFPGPPNSASAGT
jgi:predicted permease